MKIKKFAAASALACAVFGMSSPALATPGPITSGSGGVLSGNQVIIPIAIPIEICGNAIQVIALLNLANASCKGGINVDQFSSGKGHHGHHGHH